MLSADDLTQMQTDMATVRDGNAVSIVVRRGTSTLAAQTVRLSGGGLNVRKAQSGAAQEQREPLVVLGATALNIQIDDRFTLTVNGAPVLCRVTWVRPDRRVATMAKAEAIE